MRCFLALTPCAETCLAIDTWQRQHWPISGRAVPLKNLHVTITFLGDLQDQHIERIDEAMQSQQNAAFDVLFDDPGYWPDTAIQWLGCTQVPAQLNTLTKRCRHIANRVNLKVDKRPFAPHITLARRVLVPPPAPLSRPSFGWRAESIELFQSIMGAGKVSYQPLISWPLL